jgi:hypothetical protein
MDRINQGFLTFFAFKATGTRCLSHASMEANEFTSRELNSPKTGSWIHQLHLFICKSCHLQSLKHCNRWPIGSNLTRQLSSTTHEEEEGGRDESQLTELTIMVI